MYGPNIKGSGGEMRRSFFSFPVGTVKAKTRGKAEKGMKGKGGDGTRKNGRIGNRGETIEDLQKRKKKKR